MREIVKVRFDHGVVYVKLPRSFVKEKYVSKKTYMIWDTDKNGNLRLKKLRLEREKDKEFNPGFDQ